MDSTPNSTRQTQILLTNLILLSVLILGLVLLVASYPTLLAPSPTRTATSTPYIEAEAALLPSLTATITPIPSATRTLRPSATSTITPTATYTQTPGPSGTPIGPPTLTAAVPGASNIGFSLQYWTADHMAYLVDLTENYPNTLDAKARGQDQAAYFAAFDYAVVALREALMRFPDAPQAEGWRWRLAYNLARSSNPQAVVAYADLVADALNQGQLTPGELETWLAEKESRLSLSVLEFPPPSGYLSSRILLFNGAPSPIYDRGSGAAAVWLLETSSAYQVEPLFSAFDFVRQPAWHVFQANLTPDLQPEAVFYPENLDNQTGLTLPRVYDLSQVPAQPMIIQPGDDVFELGVTYQGEWIAVGSEGSADIDLLRLEARVFPSCPVTLMLSYAWDGKYLVKNATGIQLDEGLVEPALCEPVVNHAAANWGPALTLSLYEQLRPVWPTSPEKRDQHAYQESLQLALAGLSEQAIRNLGLLVGQPAQPGSPWAKAAGDFLTEYRGPDDLYRACRATSTCDPQKTLATLERNLPPDPAAAFVQLGQYGIQQVSSGYFDFDGDGQKERWFTLRHRPLEAIQLWLIAASPQGSRLLPISTVEQTVPRIESLDQGYIAPEGQNTIPAVMIEGKLALRLLRRPSDGEPFLAPVPLRLTYPDRYQEGLTRIERDLFEGGEPAAILSQLGTLAKNPGLLCRNTWSCDRYYYLLGLSQELHGDELDAIATYLDLWRNYSKSPFTVMARLKLSGNGTPPTATLLYTLTPTSSPAPTGSATITLTPTITPTFPTPTVAPTLTATSGTPYVGPATGTPTTQPTRAYP